VFGENRLKSAPNTSAYVISGQGGTE